jgi:hypothetical protein
MKVPAIIRKILDQLDSEDDQRAPSLRPIRIQVAQEYSDLISQLAEAGVLVLVDGKKPVPIRQTGIEEETGHIWMSTKEPNRA